LSAFLFSFLIFVCFLRKTNGRRSEEGDWEVKREEEKRKGGIQGPSKVFSGGEQKGSNAFLFLSLNLFFWFPILGGETRIVGMYREI
jgi:hypothetical protein